MMKQHPGAQEISNIAWACGKLRYQHLPLLDVLSAKGIEILDEFISGRLSKLDESTCIKGSSNAHEACIPSLSDLLFVVQTLDSSYIS